MEVNGTFGANGLSQAYAAASDDGSVTLYFKIKKDQNSYELAYSQDGLNYTSLGTLNNVNFANPQIGLFATQNSTATPINIYFEYLTLTNLNGVKVKEYSDMLQDAVQNALDYVVADIPTSVSTDIAFDALPHADIRTGRRRRRLCGCHNQRGCFQSKNFGFRKNFFGDPNGIYRASQTGRDGSVSQSVQQ